MSLRNVLFPNNPHKTAISLNPTYVSLKSNSISAQEIITFCKVMEGY